MHGDQARDRLDWADAAASYQRHLKQEPGDAAIWVQYGHALKEQGRLTEAEQAYGTALTLSPADPDLRRHLAHLSKRLGTMSEAARQFTWLFQRSGRRGDYGELALLPPVDATTEATTRATRTVQGDTLFIEIDDLLGFLDVHKTVTGIQRVQLGIIRHVLSMKAPVTQYMFVLNQRREPYLWRVRPEDLGTIADYLQAPDIDHAKLKAMVHKARCDSEAVLAQRGQAYLMLGAFWNLGAIADRYADMKRAGVAVGAYVYDLIPITNIEYCDEGLPHEFKLSFGDGLAVFDFVLAISDFTAAEVRRYIGKMGLPDRPVITVPLAHANDPPPSRAAAAKAAGASPGLPKPTGRSKPLASLKGRPFAMMVSTIEARKNHGYLVAAWKHFVDEGLDPPDLVFVGRPGWRVTSLLEMLAATRYLDRRVHILHDLSDAELTAMYDASLFTLFPSFVEGWGLPVGESLARGKPCVASSTSSIPEVGGDLVDYVDPFNLRDGIEVIRRMAFDAPYRNQRAAEIRRRFEPRTWSEVSVNLLNEVERVRRTVAVNTEPEVRFPSGDVFRPSNLVFGRRLPDDYAAHPLRSMLAGGWYEIEDLGCWMQGNQGTLIFRSDLPQGTRITTYLGLYGSGFSDPTLKLFVDVGPVGPAAAGLGGKRDAPTRVPVGKHFNVAVGGVVGAGGLVEVRLTLVGTVTLDPKDPDARRTAIGLSTIGYADASDQGARLQLVERLLHEEPLRNANHTDPAVDDFDDGEEP